MAWDSGCLLFVKILSISINFQRISGILVYDFQGDGYQGKKTAANIQMKLVLTHRNKVGCMFIQPGNEATINSSEQSRLYAHLQPECEQIRQIKFKHRYLCISNLNVAFNKANGGGQKVPLCSDKKHVFKQINL